MTDKLRDALAERLDAHIRMMAPHHREREAGKLLIECRAALAQPAPGSSDEYEAWKADGSLLPQPEPVLPSGLHHMPDVKPAAPQPAEPVWEPDGWKCSECHNVNNAQGVVPGKGWCSLCGAVDSMRPLYAPAPQPPQRTELDVWQLAIAAANDDLLSPDVKHAEVIERVMFTRERLAQFVDALVAPPAPQPRVPLTDERIFALLSEHTTYDLQAGEEPPLVEDNYGSRRYASRFLDFARAIEAAHGIKSEGE